MPTGYTACIHEGATFKEFARGCVGAFYHEGNVPEGPREVPSSYRESLTKAEEELFVLQANTQAAWEAQALQGWQKENDRRKASSEKNLATIAKLEGMLCQAVKWIPPSEDHVAFKKFMVDQINLDLTSERGMEEYYKPQEKPVVDDHWIAERIDWARKDVLRAQERLEEREEVIANANRWLTSLNAAIDGVGAPG